MLDGWPVGKAIAKTSSCVLYESHAPDGSTVVLKVKPRPNWWRSALRKPTSTSSEVPDEEIQALLQLRDQKSLSICALLSHSVHLRRSLLVMEHADLGCLTEYIPSRGLDKGHVSQLLLPIMEALEYMHSKNLAHFNLTTDNILLFSTPIISRPVIAKLGGLGSCRRIPTADDLRLKEGGEEEYFQLPRLRITAYTPPELMELQPKKLKQGLKLPLYKLWRPGEKRLRRMSTSSSGNSESVVETYYSPFKHDSFSLGVVMFGCLSGRFPPRYPDGQVAFRGRVEWTAGWLEDKLLLRVLEGLLQTFLAERWSVGEAKTGLEQPQA